MVTPSFARDAKEVDVSWLAELLVRPDDDRKVAVEVAEPVPARLARQATRRSGVEPLPLSGPGRAIAPPEVAADARTFPSRTVGAREPALLANVDSSTRSG